MTAGSSPSRRDRELMRLLPLWPHEIADVTPQGRRRIVAMLRRALRAERRRGLAGHWSYDLARHAQLLAAYRDEVAALGAGLSEGCDAEHSASRCGDRRGGDRRRGLEDGGR